MLVRQHGVCLAQSEPDPRQLVRSILAQQSTSDCVLSVMVIDCGPLGESDLTKTFV